MFLGYVSAGVCPWCHHRPTGTGRDQFFAGEYIPNRGRYSCPACGVVWEERYEPTGRKYQTGALTATMLIRLPGGVDPRTFVYAEWRQRLAAARRLCLEPTP